MMKLNLLGPLEFVGLDQKTSPVAPVDGKLLAVLAHAQDFVDQETVVEEVWEPGMHAALHTKVSALNRKAKEAGAGKVIQTLRRPTRYKLLTETDLQRARTALAAGRRLVRTQSTEAYRIVDEALKLWRGTPLDGLNERGGGRIYELRGEIDQLQEKLRALKVEILWELKHWDQLLADAEDFLEDHPLNEQLHRYRFLATLAHLGNSQAYNVLMEIKQAYKGADGENHPDFIKDLRDKLRDSNPGDSGIESTGTSSGCLHNLPPTTYSEFVPATELPRLQEAMDQALPVIAVTAIGGRGKRTLVHFFCQQLTHDRDFDGIVWVSGRQPGTVTLSTVLDQLAITMRHTTLDAASDKEQQVRNLLHHQRVLIVIEGYENTKDQALDRWLAELPPRSKALLTTIEYPETLREFCYEVRLMPPPPEVMVPFFTQLLKRRPIDGLEPTSPILRQLWEEWSGNYKLLEWMIGQLPDRSLAEVRASVSGTSSVDVVLTKILRGSWTGLTDEAKSVLLALTCYPNGVERQELERVTGSSADFADMLEDLKRKFFVKVSGFERPLLQIDPLVGRKIREQGWPAGEDEAIFDRWMIESISRASRAGFCPEDVSRLDEFDVPGVRMNLEYAITWAKDHQQWRSVIELGREMRYYYYVRGLWSPQTDVNLLRADAANKLGDFQEEFDALIYRLNIFAKQGNQAGATSMLERVEPLLQRHGGELTPKSVAAYRHARALHLVNQGQHAEAVALWSVNISQPEVLGQADYSANLRWYGDCLIRMGGDKRAEGRALLIEASKHAEEHGFERAQVLIELWLARLDLEDSPNEAQAREIMADLERLSDRLERINDLRYTADHHHLLARCCTLLNCDRAAEHQRAAFELDARLGIHRPAPETETK
ncbi:hypothetical protein QFZ35_003211 [Arthrobacter ulcerisalmonis]|nr:hypothetical protein [Arthrobacter ulcerisalmonis]